MLKKDVYGLTNPQMSIWLTEQYLKGTSIGNISGVISIKEKINVDKLKLSIYEFVKRNDSLQTKITIENGLPEQYFDKNIDFSIKVNEVDNENDVESLIRCMASKPFNLIESNLFNFELYTFSNGHGGILVSIHHLIGDAWTAGIIVSGIMNLYESLIKVNNLPKNNMYSYINYINSEKQYLKSSKFQKDREFWNNIFSTIPSLAEIPSQKRLVSSTPVEYTSDRKEFLISKESVNIINLFCKKNSISIFNFFMAIFSIYTNRVCNLDDFVIGTPILNRTNFNEKLSTGMYISTIPFKIHVDNSMLFVDFAKQISHQFMKIYRHQKYPYQNILQDLRKVDSRIPNLYDFLISYQNTRSDTKINSINYSSKWQSNGNVSDSLNIHLYDMNDIGSLNIAYDYQLNKYSSNDISNLHKRILAIINQIISNDNILLKDIDILSNNDKKYINRGLSLTKNNFNYCDNIFQQIEKNASLNLDKIAIESDTEKISYRDLFKSVNKLSNYLLLNNIKPHTNIGIFTSRTIDTIIGILSILKIGCTYVPIDPEYPKSRINYMIEKSNLNCILADNLNNCKLVNNSSISFVDIQLNKYSKSSSNFTKKIDYSLNDNLYIVFTSGSTGTPKGVTISHKNMLNLIYFEKEKTNIFNGNNRILQFATMSFDVSYQEIYSALLTNSTLVLIDDNIRKDSYKLTDYLLKKQIDTLFIPPAYLRLLTEQIINIEKFKTYIRNIITAGEQLIITKGIRNLIMSGIKLHNHYGPAETHVATTYTIDRKNIEVKPPIGSPIANTNIYILDNTNKICPTYTIGQIAIVGDCVGNGYFNNSDLTNNKFIKDLRSDSKMYLTGDLGYIDNKNCVYFLGRSDFQVKINGFRIELEEIDKIFMQIRGIQDSITIISEKDNKKHIISYYSLNYNISEDIIYEYLKTKLPNYMMPSRIIKLDKMPLTPNGKIDKRALPKVDLLQLKDIFIPPKTLEELEFAKIWMDIFNTDKISTNYNFFSIGGDSLFAIKLSAKIMDVFSVDISVKDIFKTPIFSELLNLILANKGKEEKKIQIVENIGYYPLSSAQKRIYYTNSLIGENNIVYNLPGAILVKTILNPSQVQNAFNYLIKRHSSFRTSFKLVDNKPMQFIEDNIEIKIDVKYNTFKNIDKIINNFPAYFDLSKAPLLHVEMYILDKEKTLILMDTHHIIVDGTSLNIIIKDFCDIYNNTKNCLSEKISYKDYAVWENKQSSNELENIENYWLSRFKNNNTPVLNLPYDYSRPVIKSYNGHKISKIVNKDNFEKYINFSNSIGLSPYMFFITAFLIVLYKYTNQNDIIIGSPTAGRNLEQLQNLVGMFVNNIVLLNNIDENDTVMQLFKKVKKTTIDALTYQPYPYDKLVKKLNLEKDLSRNPLFDVMFIYQNMPINKLTLGGKSIKFLESKTNISKFDLSLEILPSIHTINIEYCTDLFKKHTIEKFIEHYLQVLEKIYTCANKQIKDISILSDNERDYLLNKVNDTYLECPETETLTTLFEKQVVKFPNDIALVFNDSHLTYEELNKKANSLARHLRNLGIHRNDIIGIMLPRSLELIISMLAVLKSGATYIPIDPMYPHSRIEYMLNNSNARFLLTSRTIKNPVGFANKIFVELSNDNIYCLSNKNLKNINKPMDSSYIIYTSGSTGLPKGVVLNHKALVNLTYYLNGYVDFFNGTSYCKNILSVTTASFDIFIFETLISLQKGLKVILADEEAQRVPSQLNNLIKSEQAEIIQMTPSRMQFLIDNKNEIPLISKLKYVVLAGEPLPISLLKSLKHLGIKKVYNGYGPSETTVFSTFTDVTKYRKMTIGKPLCNTQIYILDKDLNLVPQGVAGELYISGNGVANGYLNNIELTNKSFIPNPFMPNAFMYKTGDSVKLLPNGEIYYIERLDNQVKIRGLRIELEEIENKLLLFPGIQRAKVVKQTIQNREFISAYFVANIRIRISELRAYLVKQLPAYMVPSYFTALDDFPYTPNGKIDKKSLPLPKAISGQEKKIERAKTLTQKKLVELWEKVLNISPIGIKDNFFELGGDSILAMNLHIELLKLSNEISYADIFSNPTIIDLSNIIDKKHRKSFEVINNDLKYKYKSILEACTTLPKQYPYISPKNILLAGVTGFLGAHILDNFLQNENGNIYCLIRNEPGLTTHIKLLDKLHYYFGDKYDGLIDKRIFIIKSDIVDESLGLSKSNIENLANSIDTVINCAAKVSHYGSYNSFYDINVRAVDNLINFCMKYNKKFYHVSTLSVSGNSFADQYYEEQTFKRLINYRENKFYIGQKLNNVYIRTKFEAEKSVFSAIQKGLDGYILRVGNLMPRYYDGKFQQNASENAYLHRLLAFLEVGCIPNSLLDGYLEFTPIDYTADAIMKLISYPSIRNRVFHIFNDNHIKIKDFLSILNIYNYIIDIKDENTFKNRIKEILDDDSQKHILNNLINDFDKDLNLSYKTNIILKSELTKKYLSNIGFKWPIINSDYVSKIIACIEFIRKGDL